MPTPIIPAAASAPKPSIFRAAMLLLVLTAIPLQAADDPVQPVGDLQLREQVDRLITQLGDPSYAKRIRARGELQRMGLLAFDALHAAQLNDDSEIAMAARYLVESLQVSWSTEDDSTDVRQILSEYGSQSEVERKSRMDRLAALPQREGLAALCRLVRFETKLRLSRSAALLIMQQPTADSIEVRRRNSAVIAEALGANAREAAKWLTLYADDLAHDEYDVAGWRAFIAAERQRVAGHTTRSSDDLAVLELYRISAVRALEHGLKSESLDLAVESLELVESRKQPLRNAVEWALDHQMWTIVLKLLHRDPSDFKNDAWLSYAVAEALTETGEPKQGEQWVAQALELAPLAPLNEDGSSPMTADARQQATQRHMLVAMELVGRGRFAWAQREYRYVIDRSPIDTSSAADARWKLAMILSEFEEHREAAEMLKPTVDRMKIDRDFRRIVERELIYAFDDFEARMHYNAALGHLQAEQPDEAAAALKSAIAADPLDGDILIAMYRFDGDEQWKRDTQRAMRTALTEFERMIRDEERQALGVNQMQRNRIISHYCNQYAWLAANTNGDLKRALAYSRRSLELTPKLASLTDTLSHCYYALGDYDAAVRTQREAVALEPHSPPIRRQLEFFIKKQQEFHAKQAADADKKSSS
ncbi:Tetratricopeptide repeat protein [Rosistilla carotiformis]|uniref:Tetratricopeptide repeat protein n=1 Tax=Rosistilla carotiformis TaxID=2528017 RepID=A0A518JUC8_9BACT|nr:hypothetical protein [Rosistilla carotiformis]QDV69151.1 Tetratricopeptide repeat protein [Rosistilla carotiformis]